MLDYNIMYTGIHVWIIFIIVHIYSHKQILNWVTIYCCLFHIIRYRLMIDTYIFHFHQFCNLFKFKIIFNGWTSIYKYLLFCSGKNLIGWYCMFYMLYVSFRNYQNKTTWKKDSSTHAFSPKSQYLILNTLYTIENGIS